MNKYSFQNDYSEGAHEKILKALSDTNFTQSQGYGYDDYCQQAIYTMREKIQQPTADIHFVSGGTQANLLVISTILRPYESVIASSVGHIAVHEAGAIESTGHKINAIDTKDGKLKVSDIQSVLDMHTDEHMVKPKLVFISNSTELGSIYTKKELTDISHFCKIHQLYLYLDGARLGAALTSEANDLTLAELVQLVDIFYIGGTKNGALCGEAIVIMNDDLKENFRCKKQKGALLAKSRLLGLQFLTFFQDDLFFSLAKHANTMASRLVEGIRKQSYSFLSTPVSNQIFPILPNDLIERMSEKYLFYVWQSIDSKHSAIRLVTSWATKEEAVNQFIEDLSGNMH